MAEHCRFEFDQFVLDPLVGQLLRDGREVPLRPQSLEVLRVLVVNAGQLVTKEQLFAAVWPKTVVTDDALVQCVRDIRVALHDEQQRMVRTVPRRGYIFTSTVAPQVGARSAEAAAPLAQPETGAPAGLPSSIAVPLPWLERRVDRADRGHCGGRMDCHWRTRQPVGRATPGRDASAFDRGLAAGRCER